MDRWEYKSLLANGPDLEKTLNPLGMQGWDVISMVAVEYVGEGYGNYVFGGEVHTVRGALPIKSVVLKQLSALFVQSE